VSTAANQSDRWNAVTIWILVGVVGAIGSIARHALNHLVHQQFLTSAFPLGIFVVNVLGSLLIGLLAGALAGGRVTVSNETRVFLVVGVLGGFTTFVVQPGHSRAGGMGTFCRRPGTWLAKWV
jgi:protein CrcB